MQLGLAVAAASPAALAYLPLIAGIVRGTVRAERLSYAFAASAALGAAAILAATAAGRYATRHNPAVEPVTRHSDRAAQGAQRSRPGCCQTRQTVRPWR